MDFSEEIITYISSIDSGGGPPVIETIEFGTSGYDIQVLAVSMQQEKDLSTTILFCGSDIIAKNYGKDLPQVWVHTHCDSEDFYVEKDGADEATVTILYATSSQHEYLHNVEVENQLYGAEQLFIAGVLIIILSFMAWRQVYRINK